MSWVLLAALIVAAGLVRPARAFAAAPPDNQTALRPAAAAQADEPPVYLADALDDPLFWALGTLVITGHLVLAAGFSDEERG